MSTQTTGLLGVNLTRTDSAAAVALGTQVLQTDGQAYMYVLANEAVAQYLTVGIDENYSASLITKTIADAGWNVGFAQTAIASGSYGWVAIRGSDITAKVLTDCAADVALYTTGTAGYLDDASSGQTKINGVVGVTTATSATSTAVEIIATWPRSNV